MTELVTLSFGQYHLVLNTLNLSVAVLGGFALVFALMTQSVGTVYRLSLALMAAVTGVASYHYLRLFENWNAAFALESGAYLPTGAPFNYVYRYADWMGTVPLILAAMVLVLDLGRKKSSSLVTRLVLAALLMIGLGYFGEIERTDMVARAVWGVLGTLPFLYILYVLWTEMSNALTFESERVISLFGHMRLLLLVSWSFYPIIYTFPMFGVLGRPGGDAYTGE